MKILSDILLKAGLVVEGVTDLQGTSTALTPSLSDNSTKIATTAFVKGQGYITAESDTLDSVTDRGATTTNILTIGGIYANSGATTLFGSEANYFYSNRISSSGAQGFKIKGYGSDLSFWRYDDGTGFVEFGNTQNYGLKLYTNNTAQVYIHSTGNTSIGSNVDAGYKLDVAGSTRVNTLTVTSATYPTFPLTIAHIGNAQQVITGGYGNEFIHFGEYGNTISLKANILYLTAVQTAISGNVIWTSGAAITQSYFLPAGGNRGVVFSANYTNSGAGGTFEGSHIVSEANVNTSISVTSVTINQFVSSPTVNVTDGTTILRGFYHNPTLTSTTGLTNIAFEATSGIMKLGNLAGTGTRMVVADSSGVLSTQAVPPTITNYVTTDTTQTISGQKTFSALTTIFDSTQTATFIEGRASGVLYGGMSFSLYMQFNAYAAATGGYLWKNGAGNNVMELSQAGVLTVANLAGSGNRMVVVNSSGVLSTQTIPSSGTSGSGSAGQVAYWNGSTSQTGSNSFFWDTVNERLGIGLTNPQRKIEIYSATADSHLRLTGNAPSVSLGEATTGSVYQAKFGLATSSGQYASAAIAGDFVIISQTGATIWGTGSTERMRLSFAGNFIVGSSSDSTLAKLQVNGSIQQAGVTSSMIKVDSNGVIVAASAGSDFVAPATLASYVPTSRTITINGVSYDLSADRSWTIAGGVTSFNTRTGAITLTSGDVTGALGYTPYNSSNPAGYITSSGSITGSAGSVAWTNVTGRPTALSSFTNDVGYITGVTNISGFSYNLYSQDVRTIAPNSHGSYRLNFGFTSWNNNSSPDWADYLHLRSYSDSSGGADNLVMFKKSGIGMRIWQQSFGSSSAYSSYVDVLHSGNYNSYSPTLTGGGASGTWGISISGVASQVSINYNNDSNANYQLLWGSGNSVYGTGSVYVNPSSDTIYAVSYRGSGNVGGTGEASNHPAGIFSQGTNWLYGTIYLNNNSIQDAANIYNSGWYRNYGQTGLYNQTYDNHIVSHDTSYWKIASANGIQIYDKGIANLKGYLYFDSSGFGLLNNQGGWSVLAYQGTGYGGELRGSWTSTSDMRAPIFYDSQNTSYYLDPAGTSVLGGGTDSDVIQMSNSSYGAYLLLGGWTTDTSHARIRVSNGNLHMDAKGGAYDIYLNWYTSRPVYFGGGQYVAGTIYDSSNTGYYLKPSSTSRMNAIVYDNFYFSGDQTYGLFGRNAYVDTINGRGSDPLEINYYDGGPVKIGSGIYGSKALYASELYDNGNRVLTYGGASLSSVYYFVSNRNTDSSNAPLQAYSGNGGGATMAFHRGGYYAVNFGLDSDNVMRIGGWSASANRWQLDMSGNMTVAGDVTAYSDARVKENVHTVDNALSKVLALRGVYYNRTDSEDKNRKIGVIAQETMTVIPEVVNQDNAGMYNVSYGNLGGLFIEAFKEQQKKIEAQDKVIEELKSLISGITK